MANVNFSRQGRDLRITEAMRNNEVRPRILPHVAARTMLDRAPGELFNHNKLLDQTVKAISLEKGIGYVEALEKLHGGLEMYPRTVRELFQNAGVHTDEVAEDVRLLERADEEAAASYAHDTRQLSQERTNAHGHDRL